MYNLAQHVQQEAPQPPTDEQIKQIQQTEKYLEKHKIHELFNEMMSKLIENRPEQTKAGLVTILKGIKDKHTFFRKSDFEQMFDNYNFFESTGANKIPCKYLIECLKNITVEMSKKQFLEKYPKYQLDRMIDKVDFVNIMESEYKQVTARK